MIVADTNLIVYLYLPSPDTAAAEQLSLDEPDWAAPSVWRSEFRNVLALHMRKGLISLEDALERQMKAEMMFAGQEFNVDSAEVLSIAAESGHPAYDCEFIALARRLRAPLVTMDQKLVKIFPQDAVLLTDFTVRG